MTRGWGWECWRGCHLRSWGFCDGGDWQGDPVCTQERQLDMYAELRGGGFRTLCVKPGNGPGWQGFQTAACDPLDPKINVVGHDQWFKTIKQCRIKIRVKVNHTWY